MPRPLAAVTGRTRRARAGARSRTPRSRGRASRRCTKRDCSRPPSAPATAGTAYRRARPSTSSSHSARATRRSRSITAMTVVQHALQAAAPFWPEELYAHVLRDSAERPQLLNAVRAEPELGAPARGGLPATVARRTADGWSVSGHKGFATGSEGLAYHLVWVVTDEAEPAHRSRHRARATPPASGSNARGITSACGRAPPTTSSTTTFACRSRTSAGAPVGTVPNNGGALGAFAVAVPALYVGVAKAALAAFVDFTRERVPTSLGRPIATLERIQSVAGEAQAQIVQAELVLSAVAATGRRGSSGCRIPRSRQAPHLAQRDRRRPGSRRGDRQPRPHPQPAVRAAPARRALRPAAPAAGRRRAARRRPRLLLS